MIDGMFISGFKAFPYYQWEYLRLRPITLIFGANGAGKSSILQSIAWLNHIHMGGEPDAFRLNLTGPHVNLGGFEKFQNRTTPGSKKLVGMGWGFRFNDPIRTPGEGWNGKEYGEHFESPGWCLRYRFSPEGIRHIIINCGQLAFVWNVEVDALKFAGFQDSRIPEWKRKEPADIIAPEFVRSCLVSMFGAERIGEEYSDEDCNGFIAWLHDQLARSRFSLNGIAPSLHFEPDSDGSLHHEFLKNIELAVHEMGLDISQFLEEMSYLGPWRKIPNAADLLSSKAEGPSDELGLWDRLGQDEGLREQLNAWLTKIGSRLKVTTRDLVERGKVVEALEDILNEMYDESINEHDDEDWSRRVEDFKINGKRINPETALIAFKRAEAAIQKVVAAERGVILQLAPTPEEIAPSDTGVGISQVVPVIIAALSSNQRKWIIEQPELHLHPKAQAELGDLFIQGSQSSQGPNHWFIIETHSEHLILRLLRRVRETYQLFGNSKYPIHPDGLAVAYVRAYSQTLEEIENDQKEIDQYIEENNLNTEINSDFESNPIGNSFFEAAKINADMRPFPKQHSFDEIQNSMVFFEFASITNIPVTRDGDFAIKWPEGFFQERLDELFSPVERKSWFGE